MADEKTSENDGRLVAIRVERPNEETVELLERLLDKARTGELQDVIVCAFGRETYTWTAMTGSLEARDATLGLKLLSLRVDELVRTLFEMKDA
jgi:hypothetical protein